MAKKKYRLRPRLRMKKYRLRPRLRMRTAARRVYRRRSRTY